MNLADVLNVVQPRRLKLGLAVAASEISKGKCIQQLVPLAEKKLPYPFNQPETNQCIAETATNPNNAAIGKNKKPSWIFISRKVFCYCFFVFGRVMEKVVPCAGVLDTSILPS